MTPVEGIVECLGDSRDVCDLAEEIRRDSDTPAAAAPIVRGGKIVEKVAVGVRGDRMTEMSMFNKPCRSTVWPQATSSTGDI